MRTCATCRFGIAVETPDGFAVQCRREAPTMLPVGTLMDPPVMPLGWWCGRYGRAWGKAVRLARIRLARRLRAFASDLNA